MKILFSRIITILLILGQLATSGAGQIPTSVLKEDHLPSPVSMKRMSMPNRFEEEALASRALPFSGDLRPLGPLETVDRGAEEVKHKTFEAAQPSLIYNYTGIALAIVSIIIGIVVVGVIEIFKGIVLNARRASGNTLIETAA